MNISWEAEIKQPRVICAKIIEIAIKLDEFHVKRRNSSGELSMHE